jgi:cytochrome c5
MTRWSLLAIWSLTLAACGKPTPQPFQDATISDLGKARWARTCALCHVNGEGGAPRFGDAAAWAPRLDQGEDVLLDHTINGYNNMPPLGYCMDCEREDFRAYIRFMSAGGGT